MVSATCTQVSVGGLLRDPGAAQAASIWYHSEWRARTPHCCCNQSGTSRRHTGVQTRMHNDTATRKGHPPARRRADTLAPGCTTGDSCPSSSMSTRGWGGEPTTMACIRLSAHVPVMHGPWTSCVPLTNNPHWLHSRPYSTVLSGRHTRELRQQLAYGISTLLEEMKHPGCLGAAHRTPVHGHARRVLLAPGGRQLVGGCPGSTAGARRRMPPADGWPESAAPACTCVVAAAGRRGEASPSTSDASDAVARNCGGAGSGQGKARGNTSMRRGTRGPWGVQGPGRAPAPWPASVQCALPAPAWHIGLRRLFLLEDPEARDGSVLPGLLLAEGWWSLLPQLSGGAAGPAA